MSITEEEYRVRIENALSGLSRHQQIHGIIRVLERLRLAHNAVGGCTEMRPEYTVSEFVAQHPIIANKISSELIPYIENNHLTWMGWRFFVDYMFEPRQIAALNILAELSQWFELNVSDVEVDPF